MSVYGEKLTSEVAAERNALNRQIVQEISKLGVSDDQVWHIIYLLSLEMEDVDSMRKIAAFVKDNRPTAFLSAAGEE